MRKNAGKIEEQSSSEKREILLFIWPYYEDENMGRAMFEDSFSGSRNLKQVCGWNRYYCVRENGSLYFIV